MKGLQEVAYLLVCLAWEMLALAKTLSFPDIPRPSWPPGAWPMEPGSSPACNVRCGWQEESDLEVTEPPRPSGSFLPITQHLTLFWSLIFSDHQHGALWEQQIHKSGQGLCWAPGRVWSLTSHLPLSRGIVKLRWPFMFYDWSLVFFWDLFPFFQTHEVWPLWAGKLCIKSVNREFRWVLKHLIQNSLRIQRWEGVLNNLAQWVNRKSLFPRNTLLAQLKDESAWASPEKNSASPRGKSSGTGPMEFLPCSIAHGLAA